MKYLRNCIVGFNGKKMGLITQKCVSVMDQPLSSYC
ncbi:MAG: hypothetical protein RL303_1547 [Verrucomicrobiota bacterium]